MLEVLPFVEDPDLSGSAAPALPQLLPPWIEKRKWLPDVMTSTDTWLCKELLMQAFIQKLSVSRQDGHIEFAVDRVKITMLNCKINGTVHIFFLKKSYLSPRCPKLSHFFFLV